MLLHLARLRFRLVKLADLQRTLDLKKTNNLSHLLPATSLSLVQTKAQLRLNMIVILLVIHVLPNLSSWSFPVANNSQQSMVTSLVPTTVIDPSIPSTNPSNNIVASTALVFPIPSKGTVYYVQPTTMFTSTTNCSIHEASTNFPQRHYLHTSKFAYFATTFCTSMEEDLEHIAKKYFQNCCVVFDEMLDSNQNLSDPFSTRGRHSDLDVYYLTPSYFDSPKRTIRNNSKIIILFQQTLKKLNIFIET